MDWRFLVLLPVIAWLVSIGNAQAGEGALDRYGGLRRLQGQTTGFFHTEKIGGRWWLVTPDGHAFYSKGCNHVTFWGDKIRGNGPAPYNEAVKAKYGSQEAFGKTAVARLWGWGFNTLGAWTNNEVYALDKMPYTPVLDLLASAQKDAWLHGNTPDVFEPSFEKAVREAAAKRVASMKSDPWCIGYFTDNELSWGPDWRQKSTLLERTMALPAGGAGKAIAAKMLAKRYAADPAKFAQVYGLPPGSLDKVAGIKELPTVRNKKEATEDSAAFQAFYARRYFEVCHDAIRAVDKHHLILGCRFAGHASDGVAAAAKGSIDVFSINIYEFHLDAKRLAQYSELAGVPVMIGEFSYRGKDSGLPNSRGAGPVVATQADRASSFETFVRELVQMPFTVGYTWFQHADEPLEGRFDGENSNYGLVNIKDEPYAPLVERMKAFNEKLEAFAAGK